MTKAFNPLKLGWKMDPSRSETNPSSSTRQRETDRFSLTLRLNLTTTEVKQVRRKASLNLLTTQSLRAMRINPKLGPGLGP